MATPGPTLLVLAGGLGTRFGALKQLQPVGPGGETMLDYAVFDARRAGFSRVVFVVGAAFAPAFEERVVRRHARTLQVACVCQRIDDLPAGCKPPGTRSRPWGTLHAVWSARETLDARFAVINADDFYGRDAYRRMAGFLAQPAPGQGEPESCAMVAYALDRTLSGHGGVNRGICRVEGGRLQAVVEHTDIVALPAGPGCEGRRPDGLRARLPADSVASMNFWGFGPAVLPAMDEFLREFLSMHAHSPDAECYLPAFVSRAIAQRRLHCHVLPTGDRWFGITYAQDLQDCCAAIQALVDQGVYPAALSEVGAGPTRAAK